MEAGDVVISALLALMLAASPLALAGAPIGESYFHMMTGVFGSKFAFSEMLTRATPLIFTGLAGVSEVGGLKGYLTADLSPGFGYTGIVVAMLAGLSPAGVVIAALFIASVFVGADSMSRASGVFSYLVDLVVATALLCVLRGGFLCKYNIISVDKQNRGSR